MTDPIRDPTILTGGRGLAGASSVRAPFGRRKAPGIGREQGRCGIEDVLQIEAIVR